MEDKGSVLVTGGAGFIGSHLCEKLIYKGFRVTCVDNLSTGDYLNILPLMNHGSQKFIFMRDDVANPDHNWGKWPYDFIFHLASRASPKDFEKHPIDIMMTNSVGTRNVLETARRNPESRFLLASTSEVYGEPEVHPQVEEYRGNVSTTGPRAPYDESKRFAEVLTLAYHRRVGVDVRIARIFNTYGPRLQAGDGRVVPNFITQALEGTPMTIYGDGKQTRSLIYVSDMVEGLMALMFTSGVPATPINLGSDKETTILEIAEIIRKKAGSRSGLEFHPLPKDDPTRRCPDIKKAKKYLKWQPKIGLEDGIERTINEFRSRPNRED